jgi:hypothetical protein
MPAKLDQCVTKVKQQLAKKYPKKSEEQITKSAFAICNASLGESARWFKMDEDFLYVDAATMELSDVTEGEIPFNDTVYELKEVKKPVAPPEKKEEEEECDEKEAGDEPADTGDEEPDEKDKKEKDEKDPKAKK